MQVGERSELRSHLVSDLWLEEVGKKNRNQQCISNWE